VSIPSGEWIKPLEQRFFDYLEDLAQCVLEAAEILDATVRDYKKLKENRAAIKAIESKGDEVVHSIYRDLNISFVTPLAKEDLSELASRLDDVLDFIYATASRLELYDVPAPTPPMAEMTNVILTSVKELRAGVHEIRNLKTTHEVIAKRCVEVNRLENIADDMLNACVAELLRDGDPVKIIKLKEIYEKLEEITDFCEDVANILEDIVAKNR